MKTVYRRSSSSSPIPGYSENAVLQLIVATGIGFVAYLFATVIFQAFAHYSYEAALTAVMPQVALPALKTYPSKWWTLLTYGWAHAGFWAWVTNMVWLFCWGNIVQMMVGHRQVIPMFVYALLTSGACYLLAQLIPGEAFLRSNYLLGSQAGVMALAIAAVALVPNYRFLLGPSFSIPLVLVLVLYLGLTIYNTNLNPVLLCHLGGGALTGFLYVRALKAGYKPADWVYRLLRRIEGTMTPDERAAWKKEKHRRNQVLSRNYEPKQGITQKRIDELLEKIHQQGYQALSKEEKELLLRASKEND